MKKKYSLKFWVIAILFFISIISSKVAECKGFFDLEKSFKSDNLNLSPMLKKIMPSVVRVLTEYHLEYHGYYYNYLFNINNTDILNNKNVSEFNNFIDVKGIDKINKNYSISSNKMKKLGSGVIVDSDNAYVITNYHVISNADRIIVILTDGREYLAKIVGESKKMDLAMLRLINSKNLSSIKIANSNDVNVGDYCVAIGSPYNLKNSVSIGIVSALHRIIHEDNYFDNYIQTDAAINHGNSGGPLVNLNGELIGINASILSGDNDYSGNIGIGFSIPSNSVYRFSSQILKFGNLNLGKLGIKFSDFESENFKSFKIPYDKGVLINSVEKGSSAEKFGLKPGDILVSLSNIPILNSTFLKVELSTHFKNDVMSFQLYRNFKFLNIKVRLGGKKKIFYYGGHLHYKLSNSIFSIYDRKKLKNKLNNKKKEKLFCPKVKGIIVNSFLPNSYSHMLGLRVNDIIIGVNFHKVANIYDFKKSLSLNKNYVVLEVMRKNKIYFFTI
ncbi:trypsin-like peptidase domain-containing protein [Buchnera aphidicola]|uniref:trypsin-like peptidase domain-containing protein n=1 Tax=Buchnera aphidicola TaxID=9 RepID=UPI002092912E|nr:trypsin-like peptidase domain-containing protein [Buchnera aphidicola]USS94553.1 trypsin-like peptidase domain-containing protein [Buchnera aphidicola (Periphyllus lyropictus)]